MNKLFKHQQEALPFGKKNDFNIALFWEPRCGKTRGTLELFKEARKITPNLRLFVACPMTLINNAWKRNVTEFTNFSFLNFKKIKALQFATNKIPDIVALNFESIISKKQILQLTQMLRKNPFMFVIDESTKIAEPKSLTTKTILGLRYFCKHRMVLTGSEIRNSELDYWGQISFIQPGVLHKSFHAFRNQFFHLERKDKAGNTKIFQMQGQFVTREMYRNIMMQGWEYKITQQKREELINLIKPFCMWVKKKDCFDLPPTDDQEREIFLSDNETRAYREMEKDLVAEIGNDIAVAPVALAKLMKLRQGTSGFFYNEEQKALVSGRSKLNELEEVLEEIGKQQMVIYAEFKYEFENIVALINKKYGPGRVATVYGDTIDRDDSIKQFEAGNVQYLVAHPRSAAHGLDFQFCSIMMFFSWSHSNELMQQARERLMGPKQDKKALYIYLVAKLKNGENTIDQDMLDVVRGKATIQEVVYRIVKGSHERNITETKRTAYDQKRLSPSLCV